MTDIKLDTMEKVYAFVKIAERFPFRILVKQSDYVVDGRSILGICSLNLADWLTMCIPELSETRKDIVEYDNLMDELNSMGIVK